MEEEDSVVSSRSTCTPDEEWSSTDTPLFNYRLIVVQNNGPNLTVSGMGRQSLTLLKSCITIMYKQTKYIVNNVSVDNIIIINNKQIKK